MEKKKTGSPATNQTTTRAHTTPTGGKLCDASKDMME
jgi:hypothetical protein